MLRLSDNRVIATSEAERRLVARCVIGQARGERVLTFGLVDTHLHTLAATSWTRCGRLAPMPIVYQVNGIVARPIEIDRERALAEAMLLCWQRGYHRTGLRRSAPQRGCRAVRRRAPVVRIRTFFERLIANAGHDRALRGCLLVNTLLETPPDEREINERAARGLGYVERSLRTALQQAQRRGELAPTQRPAALARLLLTGILGLRVYLRLRPRQCDLQGIVDSLLQSVLPAR